jgi:hypothetical protein
MKLVERSFRLEAPEGLGRKPRPELIGPILASLHGTLEDSVRMGFLHSSRARGRIPAMLKRAAEVHYVGHSADGKEATVLHFEVARFGSVAGELFEQQLLWNNGPKADETAFDLLTASVRDISSLQRDSNRYDHPLLHRIASYGRLFSKRGLRRIDVPGSTRALSARIDPDVVVSARNLFAATPPAKRVRLTGRLDLLGVSQRVLKLQLDDHNIVTAVWSATEPFTGLARLLDQNVVVEGQAIFRPSGSLLRVDADAIAHAGAQDEFFRKLPIAGQAHDYVAEASRGHASRAAYASIFGLIKGDESDEAFAAAVEEMS